MPDNQVLYSTTGPDGKPYEIAGPPGMSDEQVIAEIKRQTGQALDTEPPPTSWTDTAKDIGRGTARGIVRGAEAIPGATASLLGLAGQGVEAGIRYAGLETPQMAEEIKKREQTRQALEQARAGSSPSHWVEEHVQAPVTRAGKLAESVAGFAPGSILQPGGWLTKLLTTIGGGVGAELGEEAGGPAGEFAGGTLGVLSTSRVTTAVQRGVARLFMPSSADNRAAAKAAHDAIGQAGLVIEPTEVQNFTAGLRADLSGPNHLFSEAPGSGGVAFRGADQIEAANGDLATVMNVHSALGKVPSSAGSDYAAAVVARDSIREWIGNLQPNQIIRGDPAFISDFWDFARNTWRAHSNLEELRDIAQSAYWRRQASGAGTNLNTFRQEVRKILDNDNKARRYSPEARAQMEEIITGGLIRNSVRRLSKFAPHTAVSSIPTAITATVEPTGAGILATLGFAGHFISHVLEDSSMRRLEAVIRSESPLTRPGVRRLFQQAPARGERRAAALSRGVLAPGAGSPLSTENAEP